MPSVLWHCWLGVRKGIRPVKIWLMRCWHGYLSAAKCSLHMVQLMPLPPTSSLLQQNPEWFILLVPTHPGSPGQRVVKWLWLWWFWIIMVLSTNMVYYFFQALPTHTLHWFEMPDFVSSSHSTFSCWYVLLQLTMLVGDWLKMCPYLINTTLQ